MQNKNSIQKETISKKIQLGKSWIFLENVKYLKEKLVPTLNHFLSKGYI